MQPSLGAPVAKRCNHTRALLMLRRQRCTPSLAKIPISCQLCCSACYLTSFILEKTHIYIDILALPTFRGLRLFITQSNIIFFRLKITIFLLFATLTRIGVYFFWLSVASVVMVHGVDKWICVGGTQPVSQSARLFKRINRRTSNSFDKRSVYGILFCNLYYWYTL